MIKSILVILLFFFHYLAFAGDTAKMKIHTLGLQAGLGTNMFVDSYASANLYKANCFPIDFRWLTEYCKHFEKFEAGVFSSSYSASSVDTNMTEFKGFQTNLNYAYLANISKKKYCTLYLGPGINFLYSFSKYKYHFYEEVYYNTVDILASLDINPCLRINFKQNWFLIDASCSLAAYTGYLKYSLGSPYVGSLQAFPRYKSFLFKTSYFHQLSKKVLLNIGYKFLYYSYPKFDKTDKINRLNNQVSLGININL